MDRRIRAPGIPAFLVISSLIVSACSQQATPGPAATAVATAAPAQSAAPTPNLRGAGGELKLLFWQGPVIMNPHLSQGSKDQEAARLVVEPMASMGPSGTPVAKLAAEVPTRANGGISADGTTVTWKLKSGVKWSDGTEFTADDVVFTYEYMADKAVAATTASGTRNIKSVVARDKLTVVVTFTAPTAVPYQWGVAETSAILQKAQFSAFKGANAKDAPGNQKPIGTGPYKVKDFKPNDIITYEINENYREAGKPFFKTVQIKTVADALTAARAVCQTGDADYGWSLNLAKDQLKPFLDSGRCNNIVTQGTSAESINFNFANNRLTGDQRAEPNTSHPFLSDLKVRTALAKAIDRQTIADQIWGGLTGSASCNLINTPRELISPNTATMDVCKYDLAAANRLLDEAGWVKGPDGIRAKGGVKMEIVYQTTVAAFRQQVQDVVKKAWESLGVKVELKAIPAGVFFSTDLNSPDTASKFFADVQEYANGYGDPDPEVFLSAWASENIKGRESGWRGTNYWRWKSAEYDALYSSLVKELDPAKRRDLIMKMNDLIVGQVVSIPIASFLRPVSGAAKELKGPIANPFEGDLWNIADWTK
jgi:peptide/nickel transport system substrate-binding protein